VQSAEGAAGATTGAKAAALDTAASNVFTPGLRIVEADASAATS